MGRDVSWGQAGGNGELASQPSSAVGLPQVPGRDGECHVSLVASAPSSPEALLIGLSLGGLSAVLMVFACGYGPGDVLRSLGPAALFVCVWLSSAWLLTRDTGRVLVVMRRGFILGAFQWALLALQWPPGPGSSSGASTAAGMGPPLPTMLMHDASTVFVWMCALGFVLCWLCTRSPYSELGTSRP